MSTKRQPRANEESYQALRALFAKIAEGDATLIECHDLWRQVLDDRWFQREVRTQAASLVGGHVDEPLVHDMVQEVAIQLKGKLSKHGDLGADAAQLGSKFPAWMGNIIKHACIDTLRKERRHPHSEVTESSAIENRVPQEDLRLDMATAMDQLESRERDVAHCRLHELTIDETAEALELSERQVERSLKKVVALLKRALAVYCHGR